MPPAYVVFTKGSTLDQAELDLYKAQVGASFEGVEVKFHAAYGPHEVLEGDSVEGVVILEFPDAAAARSWYFSPAYQKAAAHRFKGAEYRCVIVEGRPAT